MQREPFTRGQRREEVESAAGVHQLLRWEVGISDKGTSLHATRYQFMQALRRHPEIRESVNYGHMVKKIMRHSLGTFLHYRFSRKDPVLADTFFVKLAQGTGLERDEPVYILRERLLEEQKDKSHKMSPIHVMALVIKAWNATREGKRIRALRWRTEGESPEEFPTVE